MGLNPRQHRAIKMMQNGDETLTQIAEDVGVSRSTLYSWMRKEEFVQELQAMQAAAQAATLAILITEGAAAAELLVDIMNDEMLPTQTRMAAIKIILLDTQKIRSATEIERRINELENRK